MKKLYLTLTIIVLPFLTLSAKKPSFVGCKYVYDDNVTSFSISFITKDTCVIEQKSMRPSKFTSYFSSDTIRYSLRIKKYDSGKSVHFILKKLKPFKSMGRDTTYWKYNTKICRDGKRDSKFFIKNYYNSLAGNYSKEDIGVIPIDNSIKYIECGYPELIEISWPYHPTEVPSIWDFPITLYCELQSGTPIVTHSVPLNGADWFVPLMHFRLLKEYNLAVGNSILRKDSLAGHEFAYNDSNIQERFTFDENVCVYSLWCDTVCQKSENYHYDIISGMVVLWKDGETKEEVLCWSNGCLIYNKLYEKYGDVRKKIGGPDIGGTYITYKSKYKQQIIKAFVDQYHRNDSNEELLTPFKNMYVPLNY